MTLVVRSFRFEPSYINIFGWHEKMVWKRSKDTQLGRVHLSQILVIPGPRVVHLNKEKPLYF